MHYFIKNTYFLLALSLLLSVTLLFSTSLSAQGTFDADALAEKSAKEYKKEQNKDLFLFPSAEEMAYADNKGGCSSKASMFFATSNKYKEGLSVREAAGIPMYEPLIQGIFDVIRKDGLEKATLNSMREYQNCVVKAPPHEKASREYDLSLKNDACGKLNGILLDVLDSIKNRKSINRIINRYERNSPDFIGTSYEDINDPVIFFIGKLYGASKEMEYKELVQMASIMGVGCHI